MQNKALEQNPGWNRLACLSLLLAVVGLTCAAAGGAEAPRKGIPRRDTPYLRIATPEGTYHVRFFGESDGPISLPLPDERYTALLLAPELTERGWSVSLGLQEDVLMISPVGRYELTMDREVPINQLDSLGIKNWSMTLELGDPVEPVAGCCGCGRVNCCPAGGKCMSCGDCGTCCGGPLEY
jgi:hypothetical protein